MAEVFDRVQVEVELKAKTDKLQKDFDRQIADLKRKYADVFKTSAMKGTAQGKGTSKSIYELGFGNKEYKKAVSEYEAGVKKVQAMIVQMNAISQKIADRDIVAAQKRLQYEKEEIRLKKERARLDAISADAKSLPDDNLFKQKYLLDEQRYSVDLARHQKQQVSIDRYQSKTDMAERDRATLDTSISEEIEKLNEQFEALQSKAEEVSSSIRTTSTSMDKLDKETAKAGDTAKKSKKHMASFGDMFQRILKYKIINSIINAFTKIITAPFKLAVAGIKKLINSIKEGMQKIYDQDKATGKETPYTLARDKLTIAMEKLSYAIGSIGVNFVQAIEPLISKFINEFADLLNSLGESIARQFDLPQYFKINKNIEDVIKEDLATDTEDIKRQLMNIDELQIFDNNNKKVAGEDGLGRYGKWVDVDPKALTVYERVQKWIDTKLNELVDFFDDFWFGPLAEDPNGNVYRDKEKGFGYKISTTVKDILDAVKNLADAFVDKLWPKLRLALLQLKSIIIDDEENELLPYIGESEEDFRKRIEAKYEEQLAEAERNKKLFLNPFSTNGQITQSTHKLLGLINDVNTMIEAEKTFFGKDIKLGVTVEPEHSSSYGRHGGSGGNFSTTSGSFAETEKETSDFADSLKKVLNKLTFGLFFNAGGGVYTAPALGVVGEYANAHSNPEIVTPQSIMRETMEQSNQNVVSTLIQCNRQLIAAIEKNQINVTIGDDVIARSANRGNATLQKLYGSNGV